MAINEHGVQIEAGGPAEDLEKNVRVTDEDLKEKYKMLIKVRESRYKMLWEITITEFKDMGVPEPTEADLKELAQRTGWNEANIRNFVGMKASWRHFYDMWMEMKRNEGLDRIIDRTAESVACELPGDVDKKV